MDLLARVVGRWVAGWQRLDVCVLGRYCYVSDSLLRFCAPSTLLQCDAHKKISLAFLEKNPVNG